MEEMRKTTRPVLSPETAPAEETPATGATGPENFPATPEKNGVRLRRAAAVMSTVRPAALPRWKERLLRKYPDAAFGDEQAMKTAFYEDYDRCEQKCRQYEADNERLIEIVRENPELGTLFAELFRGAPLRVALARADIDLPEPEADDDDYADYTAAVQERRRRKAEHEQRMKEYEANVERSKEEIDRFFAAKKMTPEEEQAFTDYVDGLVADMINGIFSQQALGKLYQSYRYEEDIREAREAGEIDGRNARIEMRRDTARRDTDGLPSNAGAGIAEAPKKQGYIERIMAGRY